MKQKLKLLKKYLKNNLLKLKFRQIKLTFSWSVPIKCVIRSQKASNVNYKRTFPQLTAKSNTTKIHRKGIPQYSRWDT